MEKQQREKGGKMIRTNDTRMYQGKSRNRRRRKQAPTRTMKMRVRNKTKDQRKKTRRVKEREMCRKEDTMIRPPWEKTKNRSEDTTGTNTRIL